MRTAIVTLYEPNYQVLADIVLPNWNTYAALHGYEIYAHCGSYGPGNRAFPQTNFLYDLMFVEDKIDVALVIGLDCLITNLGKPVSDFVAEAPDASMFVTLDWSNVMNMGSYVLRKTMQSKRILEHLLFRRLRDPDEQWSINHNLPPDLRGAVKVLNQPSLNSFPFSMYRKENGEHFTGTEFTGVSKEIVRWIEWQPGHFVCHACSRPLEQRLEILSSAKIWNAILHPQGERQLCQRLSLQELSALRFSTDKTRTPSRRSLINGRHDLQTFVAAEVEKCKDEDVIVEIGQVDHNCIPIFIDLIASSRKRLSFSKVVDSGDFAGLLDRLPTRGLIRHVMAREDAFRKFDDDSVRLLFISSSNPKRLKKDLVTWWSKIQRGGVLAGYHSEDVTIRETLKQFVIYFGLGQMQILGNVWFIVKDFTVGFRYAFPNDFTIHRSVSGSRKAVVSLYHENYGQLFDLVRPNWEEYCRRHDYDLLVPKLPTTSGQIGFQELRFVYQQMFQRDTIDWAWVIGLDILITNLTLRFETFAQSHHCYWLTSNWGGINNGSFIVRKSERSRLLLEHILSFEETHYEEQSIVREALENINSPFRHDIGLLPQPSINSFRCRLYPEHYLDGDKQACDWKPGHFTLHAVALSLEERLSLLGDPMVQQAIVR